jgi:hypothetical protein
MKYKTLAFGVMMILLIQQSQAQIFNFGLKAGINSNTFITDKENFLQGDSKIGFAGGLFFNLRSGMFSLQPEALFSHKSGMFSYSTVDDGLDTFFHASFTNIDFPLLVSFQPIRFFRVGTGPVFSYPFKEKVTFTTSQDNHSVIVDKEFFKDAAYSWQFSAAVEIGRLVFEGRYEIGIDKLNYELDLPNQTISVDPDLKARTFQFTVGYKFIKPD